MDFMLLTQQGGILKPFATILGYIMEGIFWVLDNVGIPNIGLAIILFTFITNILMIPLTIKQQKFSKLSSKMNPEIQAIQAKYKGKSDQASLEKMNQETQLVYAKYGVNPSGSCLQLLIQMPILFALYRVIYNVPAYVGKIKEAFIPLVDQLVQKAGSVDLLKSFSSYNYYKKQFASEAFTNYTNGVASPENMESVKNTFIDVLNRASTTEWKMIYDTDTLNQAIAGTESTIHNFPELANLVTNAAGTGAYDLMEKYNSFLGLNIGNSPSYTIKSCMAALNDQVNVCDDPKKMWFMIIGVIMIPVLAAVTQWINTKLMPQPDSDNKNKTEDENPMVQSMKTMNTFMPIMSAVFCYTLPVGLGIYWISGSVVRSIIQICVNKHLDKIDIDEMIKKNIEKENEKRRKLGLPPQTINTNATINTRQVEKKENRPKKEYDVKAATEYYNNNENKPGSLASKAAMVKKYNEKNTK